MALELEPDYRPSYQADLIRRAAGLNYDHDGRVPLDKLDTIMARAGIYILLGEGNRIVHMGKARRTKGIRARIAEHMHYPERRAVTREVVYFAMDPMIRPARLLAIEGRVADLLRVRGRIRGKRWPLPGNDD